ncbi:hypothetical protein NECAME_14236 [Necator americanus]|uniref:Mos1 transposase HTH domain-containing protein n=1 Tax=Necator americanus TaxID=51031 RepID=W2SRS5_NECAM|nr:hypothetical protein NECAME_14236 [Necator americanus]ETN71397.1 hypothetical protein NECAME_14236 [Necator americanus]
MAEDSTHIRHVLLYEFESGHTAAEARQNVSQVFGTEAPSERSVRAWFQRFEARNLQLGDEPRSGRPTAISLDELKNLAEQHPYEGVRYFAPSLGCPMSTVSNGPQFLGVTSVQRDNILQSNEQERKFKTKEINLCSFLTTVKTEIDSTEEIK